MCYKRSLYIHIQLFYRLSHVTASVFSVWRTYTQALCPEQQPPAHASPLTYAWYSGLPEQNLSQMFTTELQTYICHILEVKVPIEKLFVTANKIVIHLQV